MEIRRWVFIQTQRVAADSTEHKNQAVINMDCSSRHAAMVDDGLIPANFSRKKWSTAFTKRAALRLARATGRQRMRRAACGSMLLNGRPRTPYMYAYGNLMKRKNQQSVSRCYRVLKHLQESNLLLVKQ